MSCSTTIPRSRAFSADSVGVRARRIDAEVCHQQGNVALQERVSQSLLGGKELIERTDGRAGTRSDLGHGFTFIALFCKHRRTRREQLCHTLFAGLAWSLTRFTHTDALTAYLATSPGGLDSIAIIAASNPHVDIAFVLALQAVRLVLVILLSPLITCLVVKHSPHLQRARA